MDTVLTAKKGLIDLKQDKFYGRKADDPSLFYATGCIYNASVRQFFNLNSDVDESGKHQKSVRKYLEKDT